MREPQSERKRSRLKPNQEWRNHDDGFQYRFPMPALGEDEPTRRKREHRNRAALTSARAAVGLGVGSGRSAQNRNQFHAEREMMVGEVSYRVSYREIYWNEERAGRDANDSEEK